VKIQYSINPTGSNFTFEELAKIVRQNFDRIELISDFEFEDPTETDVPPGTLDNRNRTITFAPATSFPDPNDRAIAKAGVMFNIDKIKSLPISDIRAILLHEFTHNFGVAHTTNQYSVMSTYRFFRTLWRGLFYRRDLVTFSGFTSRLPNNVICADEHGRLLIPAISYQGTQWWVLLQYLENQNLLTVQKAFPADDGIAFTNPSTFADDILTLDKVHTFDGILEDVKLKWIGNNKLELVRDGEE